jgi:hypothetical protein
VCSRCFWCIARGRSPKLIPRLILRADGDAGPGLLPSVRVVRGALQCAWCGCAASGCVAFGKSAVFEPLQRGASLSGCASVPAE